MIRDMGMDEDVDRTIFQDEFLPALTVAGRTWRSIFRQDFMEPQLASESPLPSLRTAPHLPAWCLPGLRPLLRPLLRAPERRLSSVKARHVAPESRLRPPPS